MHIYAFGSICRGDISVDSDIDLLALVDGRESNLNPDMFSIYSYLRINELWEEGNAFAWHLALESKLIYASDGDDYLMMIGMPSQYTNGEKDCNKFREIFESALRSLQDGTPSTVFELSTIFLAIRNIATCYSLAKLENPTFGRDSARRLDRRSVPLSDRVYSILMRARVLSTRGMGNTIGELGDHELIKELLVCQRWVNDLCSEVRSNG